MFLSLFPAGLILVICGLKRRRTGRGRAPRPASDHWRGVWTKSQHFVENKSNEFMCGAWVAPTPSRDGRVDKMLSDLIQYLRMRHIYRLLFLSRRLFTPAAYWLRNGRPCERGRPVPRHRYKPNNPSAVRVKVSLSKQNVYVMEGDRNLMAAAISVGTASKPTPREISAFIRNKSTSVLDRTGFSVQGDRIVPSTGGGAGRYVGYPMGYWCEFAPAYGFHQGFVHPAPHTHGCIRLPRFSPGPVKS